MNTLNLTIPLTIPQLAELIRTQFSAEERQQLAELVQEPKLGNSPPEEASEEPFSLADSLREAIHELNQYKRGEITLPTLEEFLDELQNQTVS